MAGDTLDLGNLLIHLRADNAQYKRVLGGSLKLLKGTMSKMSKYARRGALAMIGLGAASVKAYASFDDAMTKSLAIMGDVSPKMRKEMEITARMMAVKSVTSATTLAKSYFYLASAGLGVKQSIAALPAVEKFAVAGAFDMAEATTLAMDAQSALGLRTKEAQKNLTNLTRVTDVLVGANTLANANTRQFSASLTTQAGPAMKAYNVRLEEGVAMLAAYAEQGIKGEHAGAMYGRMLRLMMKGHRDNAEAWKKMNIQIFDATGELLPMHQIIKNLTKAIGNLSTEQKIVALDMLGFQARSQQAILPILGMGDAVEEYTKRLDEMSGITREVALKQLKSFSSQMKILWNNIKDVAISIGSRLAPSIQKIGLWVRENRLVIEDWAIAFTDRVVFIKDMLWDLLNFLRTDFTTGFGGVLHTILILMKAAAKMAIDLAIRTGKGLWRAIKKSIISSVRGEDILEEYKKLGGQFGVKGGKKIGVPIKGQRGPMFSLARAERTMRVQRELWEEAEQKAKESAQSRVVEGVMKGYGASVKRYMQEAIDDIKDSSVEVGSILQKNLAVLHGKDTQRKVERLWQEAKKAAEPYGNILKGMKNSIMELVTFGTGKKKIISELIDIEGIDEFAEDKLNALRSMLSEMGRMSRELYDVEIKLLDMQLEEYKKFIDDKDILNQWYLEQVRKLDIELLKSSDSLIDGFKAAGMQMKEEIKTWGEVAYDVAMSMKTEFGNSMYEMIENAKTFKEAMLGVLDAVRRAIIRAITEKMAAQLMSGFMGFMGGGGATVATGAVINHGRMMPFASGGLVSNPTFFPMAKGDVGLMGERGEEAIMPLTRRGGKLGVEAEGMGTKNFTANFNISSIDSQDTLRAVAPLKKHFQDWMREALNSQHPLRQDIIELGR